MGSFSKSFALILSLIVAISSPSLMMVKPVCAQSTPKPSVPEFTIKLIAYPYDVAPTTTIDPHTGKNVTTQAGYHVENITIEVTIKNHPFAYSFDGKNYNLYYDVRTKGHFGQDWTELYPVLDRPSSYINSSLVYSKYVSDGSPPESNSDYTVLSYLVGANGDYPFTQLSSNAQVDFQVEAIVGHNSQVWTTDHPTLPPWYGYYISAIAYDISSDWSNTQTTIIGSTSTSPNPTPTVPEFPSGYQCP